MAGETTIHFLAENLAMCQSALEQVNQTLVKQGLGQLSMSSVFDQDGQSRENVRYGEGLYAYLTQDGGSVDDVAHRLFIEAFIDVVRTEIRANLNYRPDAN